MALSPSHDQPSTPFQSTRSPREGVHIPATTSSHAWPAFTAPMSVPHSKPKKSPPPPLPPPRFIDMQKLHERQELVHRTLDGENGNDGSVSIRPGSSLIGGSSGAKPYIGLKKHVDLGIEGNGDSGERAQDMPDLGEVAEYNKLQGERQLGHRSNERSSAAYDKQVLARMGGPPSTPPRSAGALSFSGAAGGEDPSSPKSFRDFGKSLRPLSGDDRRSSDAAESPRWQSSALSPTLQNLKSPLSDSDVERRSWSRLGPAQTTNNPAESKVTPSRESRQGNNMSLDHEATIADDAPLSELNINDKRPHSTEDTKIGQKRRAQSPPTGTIDPSLRNTEDTGRRENPHLVRMQNQEPPSLASSASSNMQSASYQSSFGFSAGSSATSYSSQRPGSSHPSQPQPQAQQATSPQEASGGQTIQPAPQQPQQQQMGPPPLHRRAGSSGIARPPGVFICECCPKKPKKFDNEEELRVHEMEKQYFCQFCHNRFKNKNEAERHQNSLHLRRHSWSCAQLQSLEDAFHATLTTPNVPPATAMATQSPSPARLPNSSATDTCGYCGTEFPNPPDWNARVEHLNHIHKFGECNQSKKFFRADHFRQHLKHSHAGTSGRWTNMLENACMREEAPPQPPSHIPMGMTTAAPIPVGQIHHLHPHPHPQYPQAGQMITQPQMQQMAMQNPPMQPPQMQPPQAPMQQAQGQSMRQTQEQQSEQMVTMTTPQPGQQMQATTQVPPVVPSFQGPVQTQPAPAQQVLSTIPGPQMTQQQAQEAALQATQQASEQQLQSEHTANQQKTEQTSLPSEHQGAAPEDDSKLQ